MPGILQVISPEIPEEGSTRISSEVISLVPLETLSWIAFEIALRFPHEFYLAGIPQGAISENLPGVCSTIPEEDSESPSKIS